MHAMALPIICLVIIVEIFPEQLQFIKHRANVINFDRLQIKPADSTVCDWLPDLLIGKG
jgi:hypothetical protein